MGRYYSEDHLNSYRRGERDDYREYGNPRRASADDNPYRRKKSRKSKKGVWIMYLIMALFFGVVIVTVMFGKMYVKSTIRHAIGSGDQPVSSESAVPSEPEAEPVDTVALKVEEELSAMTLEQKVGQLFMVRNNGGGGLKETVSKTNAGGAILFAKDFEGKTAAKVRKMTDGLQAASDGRLIIAVDEEGGTVVRVSSNTKLRKTKFLSPQKLYKKGGFDLIKYDTKEKCRLLDSLGINMNMAPVADVCTSSSGFMYYRSFGKGAKETAKYVSAVVTTMKDTPVASCVKHFPGYGNSKKDTHKGLDVNQKSLDKLKASDLVPFEAAIRDGVDSILLTHTIVNAIDPDHPASLSPDVVKMIRVEMGFDGLLITDGLEMGAVIKYSGDSGKVCVMAVNAGIDILCAPKNPVSDYKAVLKAAQSGEISEERINESVRRILRFKQRFASETSDPSTPESEDEASSEDEPTTVTTTRSTTQSTTQTTTEAKTEPTTAPTVEPSAESEAESAVG